LGLGGPLDRRKLDTTTAEFIGEVVRLAASLLRRLGEQKSRRFRSVRRFREPEDSDEAPVPISPEAE